MTGEVFTRALHGSVLAHIPWLNAQVRSPWHSMAFVLAELRMSSFLMWFSRFSVTSKLRTLGPSSLCLQCRSSALWMYMFHLMSALRPDPRNMYIAALSDCSATSCVFRKVIWLSRAAVRPATFLLKARFWLQRVEVQTHVTLGTVLCGSFCIQSRSRKMGSLEFHHSKFRSVTCSIIGSANI